MVVFLAASCLPLSLDLANHVAYDPVNQKHSSDLIHQVAIFTFVGGVFSL